MNVCIGVFPKHHFPWCGRLSLNSSPRCRDGLQLIDRRVDLHAEGDAIDFVEHGFVEALDDAVGLRTPGLGSGVIDALDGEIELIHAARITTIFGSRSVSTRCSGMPCSSWKGITRSLEIGGGDRRLAVIELGEADLGVGVDEGLLVTRPTPSASRRKRCPARRNNRAFGNKLAMRLLVGLGLFQGGDRPR